MSAMDLLPTTKSESSLATSNTREPPSDHIVMAGGMARSEQQLLAWNGRDIPNYRMRDEFKQRMKKRLPAWMVLRDLYELCYLGLVLLNIIPVAVLVGNTSRLSNALGDTACLPSGNFRLPRTASIWDKEFFFLITVALGQNRKWSFQTVKIVDIFWDVVIGRGGQIILVYISYRVFQKSLAYAMETQSVSYRTYTTVAFETGKLKSMWNLLKAMRDGRFKPNRRGYRIFTLMLLCTVYIVAMPTLYSAMSGYTPVAALSVEIPPEISYNGERQRSWDCSSQGNCTITPCGGPGAPEFLDAGERQDDHSARDWPTNGLQPAWGMIFDANRTVSGNYTIPARLIFSEPITEVATSFINYYNAHREDYEAAERDPRCQNVTSLLECPPLAKPSRMTFVGPDYEIPPKDLDAPMLNIQKWDYDATSHTSNFWICSGIILEASSFNEKNVTAICNAGSDYLWGFSFLILFIVTVCQLLFAVIVYTLWIEAHRYFMANERIMHDGSGRNAFWEAALDPSLLSSAIAIADQAERQYGSDTRGWTTKKLDAVFLRGRKGVRMDAGDKTEPP